MRLWPRRKVIYTWDHNFAPTLDYYPGPYTNHIFQWYCPDNAYVRLSSLHGTWYLGSGAHPATNVKIFAYRGQHVRFQLDVVYGVGSRIHLPFTAGATLYRYASISPFYTRTIPWPHPLHMLPGDSIAVQSLSPWPGDYFHDLTVSYDRWELL